MTNVSRTNEAERDSGSHAKRLDNNESQLEPLESAQVAPTTEHDKFLAWFNLDVDPELVADLWTGWQARAALAAEPVKPQPDILEQIATKLTIMLASATAHGDGEWITGYTVKTGALHSILGILQSAGAPVDVPLHEPKPQDPFMAHVQSLPGARRATPAEAAAIHEAGLAAVDELLGVKPQEKQALRDDETLDGSNPNPPECDPRC